MNLLVTDAVVLHSLDYLESSRILRLATRDAGVQSVLARGARTSKKRFGSALGLFAEGQAQIQMKSGRELHTLASFDVVRVQPTYATDLGRFTAASAFAECVLRLVHDENAPRVYQHVVNGLDAIAASTPEQSITVTLGSLWRLVSEIGFTPTLVLCAECHAHIATDDDTMFSHVAGGVLCARCSVGASGARRLPGEARATLARWLSSVDLLDAIPLSNGDARAHQRLVREFLSQHVPEARIMKAYAIWEQGSWGTTAR